MAIKVAYLNFNLHKEGNVAPDPSGVLGFEEWLQDNVNSPPDGTILDVHHDARLQTQVVIYDDGT